MGLPATGSAYEAQTVHLSPGSLLCVFSDAFPEAQVREEFYEEDRFFQSVKLRHQQPLEEIVDGVLEDLSAFLGDTPLGDDATLLLIRRQE